MVVNGKLINIYWKNQEMCIRCKSEKLSTLISISLVYSLWKSIWGYWKNKTRRVERDKALKRIFTSLYTKNNFQLVGTIVPQNIYKRSLFKSLVICTCLSDYTEVVSCPTLNCEASKISKFFKNRKRKYMFFKCQKVLERYLDCWNLGNQVSVLFFLLQCILPN